MTAASQIFYNDGLISTDDGSPADPRLFIGNGTLWAVTGAPLVYPGDTLFVPGHEPLPIVTVTDNTHITVGLDYTGSPLTDSEYFILYTSPLRYQQFALASAIRAQVNRNSVFDSASPVFSVKTFNLNAPEGSEVVGDRFVVGPSASGAFQGHPAEIAEKTETGWLFTIPQHGWSAIDEEQNLVHLYDGTEWLAAAGLGASVIFIDEWDALTTFTPGNVVTHNDEAWISTTTNTNSEPAPGSDDWRPFVRLGVDGGAFTLRYTFLTDTTDGNPGTGKVKFNAVPGSATIIRVSRYDAYGSDWGALIAGIGTSSTSVIKGKIRIVTKGDLTRQWIASVSAVAAVGAPDYYNLTISSPSVSVAALQNNASILFMFQERGDVGAQGLQGIQGLRGYPGGPIAIDLVADLSTTENSDPGTGKLRFGSAPQNTATIIRVDASSSAGVSITDQLAALATISSSNIKALGRLFDRENPARYLTFNIVSVETLSGYSNLTVAMTGASAANPFVTGDNLVLAWTPKGDKGQSGTIAVGAVTTGVPGTNASVVNVGSAESAVLNFTIPRGDTGDNFRPQQVVEALSSSENLFLYSQEFDNAAWTKAGCSISANDATAPDGTATADKFIEGSGAGQHYIHEDIGAVAIGDVYTVTVYAKANGRNVAITGHGEGYTVFDLSNGTVVQDGGNVATIEAAANGYYRCRATITKTNTNGAFYILGWNASNSYTGDGASGFWLWGAQIESGDTPTPYVATTSAQVLRVTDRSLYDDGPVFDENGERLSVLVLSDETNDDKPTLYFLMEVGPAVWSTGVTFGQVATAASEISFDDSNAGLGAATVQDAVDAAAESIARIPDPVAMAIIFGS